MSRRLAEALSLRVVYSTGSTYLILRVDEPHTKSRVNMCKPAKVSQRAARKAAAACLARQRHKTFVQSLQEQANELHVRSAPALAADALRSAQSIPVTVARSALILRGHRSDGSMRHC